MAELNVQQQNLVKELRQAYPELKSYSDEQILTIYNQQLANVQLSEDERISIMSGRNGVSNDGVGLQVETMQTVELTKDQEKELLSALTKRINDVTANTQKAEEENGFLGKAWNWAKNTPLLDWCTDSTNDIKKAQQADLKALESGNIKEAFKQITGLDYTVENVNKFLNNEIQTTSEQALNGYKEGQDMASDVVADIFSGIAAVGIYTAAVALAPVSGGASIAVGIAAATASGAAIKTGIKFADTVSSEREYTSDNLKRDLATGAFSGVLAPITGGMGGAVGKTVATKMGVQAVKQVGKEVADTVVESSIKQGIKTALTNPTGYEYVGGTLLKRSLAFGAEMATDGAIGGAVDNAFRTAYDGGSLEDVGNATVQGFVGGAIMSPIIGGGMKFAGKGAQKIFGKDNVEIDANGHRIRINEDGTVVKIDKDGNAISEVLIRELDNEQPSIIDRLSTANSREDFVAIRDEIKAMPNGAEKTALQQEYLAKYNTWSRKYSEEFDIRMEYKPEKQELNFFQKNMVTEKIAEVKRALKESLTKDELERADELIKMLEDRFIVFDGKRSGHEHIQADHIKALVKIKDFDIDRFNEILNLNMDGLNYWSPFGHTLSKLMQMSKQDYIKLKDILGEHSQNISLLDICSSINSQYLDRLRYFTQNNLFENIEKRDIDVARICNLEEDVWTNIQKRGIIQELNCKCYGDEASVLAKLSDEEYNLALSRDIIKLRDERMINTLLELSDADFELIKKLGVYDVNEHHIRVHSKETLEAYLNLTPVQEEKIIKYHLTERYSGFSVGDGSPDDVIKLLNMDNDEFQSLVDKGIFEIKIKDRYLKTSEIKELSILTKEEIDNIVENILPANPKIKIKQAIEFSELTEQELEKIKKFNLFEEKVAERTLYEESDGSLSINARLFRMFEGLAEGNVPPEGVKIRPSEILRLVKLEDEEIVRTLKLMKHTNVKEYGLSELIRMSKLSSQDFEIARKLFEENPDYSRILKYATKEVDGKMLFDKATFEQALKLQEIIPEELGNIVGEFIPHFELPNGKHSLDASNEFIKFIKEIMENDDSTKIYLFHLVNNEPQAYTKQDILAKRELFEFMQKDSSIELKNKMSITGAVNADNISIIKEILTLDNPKISKESKYALAQCIYKDSIGLFKSQNIEEILLKIENQKLKALERPELYVNGEYETKANAIAVVEHFFSSNFEGLAKFAAVFDKEALNNLLRMRFNDVSEYISSIKKFSEQEFVLLKQLCELNNIDNKPFMPTQKIEFIDVINAYKENNIPLSEITELIKDGSIDIGKLNIQLFKQIMKNSGLTDAEIASIPKEKLTSWDTKYAHLLSKEIATERDVAFSDIIRIGNLEPDLMKYIHESSNIYGQANINTRTRFQELGMDYDSWIKPAKEHELKFIAKDRNTEQLSQIANQVIADINNLMQNPALKGLIKKRFPKFMIEDKFIIPDEYLNNKAKLRDLVEKLSDTSEQGQLRDMWLRAQGNVDNPDPKRALNARNTITVLNHLTQYLDNIAQVSDSKAIKELDLTIKMWDRVPQKDIFQGNYSTCCIGMGGGNGSAMPHFILNTSYNMIELVDNKTGKIIGNALCYFITDSSGKPAFIIDNIEINNGMKPSSEVGIQLRNSMAEYAAKISKDITGNDNTPVYMSSSYNDVPIEDLTGHRERVSFVGDVDCDDIYMDLYKGWVSKSDFTSSCNLLKIR